MADEPTAPISSPDSDPGPNPKTKKPRTLRKKSAMQKLGKYLPQGEMGNFVGAIMAVLFLSLAEKVWGLGKFWIPIGAVLFVALLGIGMFVPKGKQKIFQNGIWIGVIMLVILSIIGATQSGSKHQPANQSITVQGTGHTIQQAARDINNNTVNIYPTNFVRWETAFEDMDSAAKSGSPSATRTFNLLRERGSSFSLGPCPGEN